MPVRSYSVDLASGSWMRHDFISQEIPRGVNNRRGHRLNDLTKGPSLCITELLGAG